MGFAPGQGGFAGLRYSLVDVNAGLNSGFLWISGGIFLLLAESKRVVWL